MLYSYWCIKTWIRIWCDNIVSDGICKCIPSLFRHIFINCFCLSMSVLYCNADMQKVFMCDLFGFAILCDSLLLSTLYICRFCLLTITRKCNSKEVFCCKLHVISLLWQVTYILLWWLTFCLTKDDKMTCIKNLDYTLCVWIFHLHLNL